MLHSSDTHHIRGAKSWAECKAQFGPFDPHKDAKDILINKAGFWFTNDRRSQAFGPYSTAEAAQRAASHHEYFNRFKSI